MSIWMLRLLGNLQAVSGGVWGGGRGTRVLSRHFSQGIFFWPAGKREARVKGKMNEKERKILKWEGKKYENEQRTPFFYRSTIMEISTRTTFSHCGKIGKVTLALLKNISFGCQYKYVSINRSVSINLLFLMHGHHKL